VLDEGRRSLLRRLVNWLTPFRERFGHAAQQFSQISLGQHSNGLLSDSARKSMKAMLARVTAPVRYQAFQHFVTHAPWDPRECGAASGRPHGDAGQRPGGGTAVVRGVNYFCRQIKLCDAWRYPWTHKVQVVCFRQGCVTRLSRQITRRP